MKLNLDGAVAVITGAASGMGAELAVRMAAKGSRLALVDRDAAGLDGVSRRIAALHRTPLTTHVADLADRAAIAALPDAVLAAHGKVTVLVSNAGVALAGPFDDYGPDDFEWLMDINFWAGIRLTTAFLPHLKRAPAAQIAYTSSVFGIVGVPGNVAYCASKFAIRGFAEAVRQELAGTSVGITVIHPGGVNTAIARSARVARGTDAAAAAEGLVQFEKLLRTPADKAAAAILDGIERRRNRVLIGADARVLDWIQRLLPVGHAKLVARQASFMSSSLAAQLTRARP